MEKEDGNIIVGDLFDEDPLGLGRLPVNDSRYFASEHGRKAIAAIKKRIEAEVFPIIQSLLTPENNLIQIDGILLGDLNEQKIVCKRSVL